MRNDYLNLIQNELLQDGFIFYRAIRGEEAAIDALHRMVVEEQPTKGHFVDFLAIEPVRPHRIARSIFAHRHTSFLRCCGLSMWPIWPHMDFLCRNRWINVLFLVLRSIDVIILITLISSAAMVDKRPFHLM